MTEISLSRASVRWLILEGFAVVASILLAFSIDAWWESRQQREDERVVLQSLLDDLIDKKKLLAGERHYNEAIFESATKLLHAATDTDQKMSKDNIDRLIGDTWWYNDPSSWDSAPMNSLIIGGDLSNISNARLLQELSLLQISFSKIKNSYKNDENFHHNTLTPFLISNVNLPQVANAVEHQPGFPENTYIFPDFKVSGPYDHSELLTQIEFQNLLIAKIDRLLDISVNAYFGVDEQLDEVILLINEELTN